MSSGRDLPPPPGESQESSCWSGALTDQTPALEISGKTQPMPQK